MASSRECWSRNKVERWMDEWMDGWLSGWMSVLRGSPGCRPMRVVSQGEREHSPISVTNPYSTLGLTRVWMSLFVLWGGVSHATGGTRQIWGTRSYKICIILQQERRAGIFIECIYSYANIKVIVPTYTHTHICTYARAHTLSHGTKHKHTINKERPLHHTKKIKENDSIFSKSDAFSIQLKKLLQLRVPSNWPLSCCCFFFFFTLDMVRSCSKYGSCYWMFSLSETKYQNNTEVFNS